MSKIGISKFINFWFPVVVYSAIIFYASSFSRVEIPIAIPFIDKLLHVFEYGILGFLFARALNRAGDLELKMHIVLFALLFCFLYGISDEYHQIFVPGRVAAFADVVADGIGGALGGFLYPIKRL